MNRPKPRRIQLSEGSQRTLRMLAEFTAPGEGKTTSWVTLTRTGSFTDPRYGRFEITRDMLLSMVRNFDAQTFGQDIYLDVNHNPGAGAAAKVLKLSIEGDRLRAQVEWTPYGLEAVQQKGYRYLSAEYHENYQDNEKGAYHGPTLVGAGLTVRPVIKRLDPVTLSCASDSDDSPILIHPELIKKLLSEEKDTMNKYLQALLASLQAKKLSQTVIDAIMKTAEAGVQLAAGDEAAQKKLCEDFEATAKTLAENIGAGGTVQLSMTSAPQSSIEDAVRKMLAENASTARQLAEKTDANRKLLSDTINAAEGIDDATKKELAEGVAGVVTADMSEAAIKQLATAQIASGNQIAAAKKLAAMGYHPQGTVQIEVVDEGSKKLSGIYHGALKKTSAYANGQLRLSEKASAFVDKVLAQFDRIHAREIHDEARMLAEGTGMANVSLPVGFQREVIREALSDLNILQLVNAVTDFTAQSTTLIPYETRDVSGVLNDGVVFEGQEINYAGISQAMDTAYITPMKVAYLISNEVANFTRTSGLNWDAMSRNIETCSRVMRELVQRRLANELQRSSDAYGAVAVTGENVAAQLSGSSSVIKTTNFPIVRPKQAYDMAGNAIGSTENPLAVVVNGATLTAYDGSGNQATGTYYRVTNYNMGYIQLVDQSGAAKLVTASGACTVGYSYATNILKVDIDVPSGSTLEVQLNKVIQGVGARKAMMNSDRYILPDFLLMSPVLNDTISNAEQFIVDRRRNGSDTNSQGDLDSVKSIPSYGTNAPGIDLGDQRIVMGQRGQLTYTVAKPFELGQPFEAVGANGKPIGKKQAYGEEYNAMHLPTPIRNRLTSVLVYSKTGR